MGVMVAVFGEGVEPEVGGQISPYRVRVIRSALRVVVLDE